ncbi:hypothetical protein ADIARSV_3229 [Arcticibacter svalbardensis MN12-7]|uniref:Uncharacterized protein n=1 Tax=Arcticibacter svalbardensis MN12-7 TaxID=1150600 RepID=R9GP73_9SPHI|nr:hypothetical protein ADIARSV_3229 [Arcticibacter svalbardensis MN12-7]
METKNSLIDKRSQNEVWGFSIYKKYMQILNKRNTEREH